MVLVNMIPADAVIRRPVTTRRMKRDWIVLIPDVMISLRATIASRPVVATILASMMDVQIHQPVTMIPPQAATTDHVSMPDALIQQLTTTTQLQDVMTAHVATTFSDATIRQHVTTMKMTLERLIVLIQDVLMAWPAIITRLRVATMGLACT
jgi:hypothetical protein